jgi:hypothetical protein
MLLDHEQRAVGSERQAIRHLQPVRDLHHLVGDSVSLGIEDRENPVAAGADVDPGAVLGDRERARPRHLREHLDRKAWRRAQAIEGELRATRARDQVGRENDADGETASEIGLHGQAPQVVWKPPLSIPTVVRRHAEDRRRRRGGGATSARGARRRADHPPRHVRRSRRQRRSPARRSTDSGSRRVEGRLS